MSEHNPLLSLEPVRSRRLIKLCGLLSGLLIFVLLLIPLGMEWGLEWWLSKETGQQIEIDDIDFNPFSGKLTLALFKGDHQNRALNLGQGSLDFNWWSLWDKRLVLSEITITDANIQIEREKDGTLHVGAFSILATTPSEGLLSEDEEPWGFGIDQLQLKNLQIDYLDPEIPVRLRISNFSLQNLTSWDPEQLATLVGHANLNDGNLDFNFETRLFREHPQLEGNLIIEKLPLGWLQPLVCQQVEELAAKLSLNVNLSLTDFMDQQALRATVNGPLELVEVEIVLAEQPYRIAQQQLSWNGVLTLRDFKSLVADGSLDGSGLSILDTEKNRLALQLGRLQLDKLHFAIPKKVVIEHMRLIDADLLEVDFMATRRPLVSWQELAVSQLNFTGKRVTIEEISFAAMVTSVGLDQDGKLLGKDWLQRPDRKAEIVPESETVAGEHVPAHLTFAINQLNLIGNSSFSFVDNSFDNPVEIALSPLKVSISKLDSAAPGQKSDISLETQFDKYSSLSLSGTAKPFLPQPEIHLRGQIKSLNLPDLSPYTVRHIGYRITSGHLDTDIAINTANNQLDISNELFIAKPELEAVQSFVPVAAKGGGDLPLSLPLSLLKDKNGDISLELPIAGKLDDPEFSLGPAFQHAVFLAIQNSATSMLAPLGVQLLTGVVLPPGTTWLAGALFDMMTRLRFDPLVFPAGSAETASVSSILATTGNLLQKRPQLRLRLCGWATPADLQLLQQTDLAKWNLEQQKTWKPKRGDKKTLSPAHLTETVAGLRYYREQLLGTALQRSEKIKAVLINRHQIEAERLFLCDPTLDQKEEAQPRVEILL